MELKQAASPCVSCVFLPIHLLLTPCARLSQEHDRRAKERGSWGLLRVSTRMLARELRFGARCRDGSACVLLPALQGFLLLSLVLFVSNMLWSERGLHSVLCREQGLSSVLCREQGLSSVLCREQGGPIQGGHVRIARKSILFEQKT